MKARLEERSQSSRRPDDLHEAVDSRIKWFHNCVAEIAHYYGPHKKLYTVSLKSYHLQNKAGKNIRIFQVDANRPEDSVYKDMSQVVELWV